MKKNKLIIMLFVGFFGVLLFLCFIHNIGNVIKYDIGKDTVDILNDGEYKILKTFNKENGSFISLSSDKYGQIIYLIDNYKQEGNYIFFKGLNYGINGKVIIFAVLNVMTNVIWLYPVNENFENLGMSKGQEMINDKKLVIVKSMDEFTENEQRILLAL